MKKLTVLAFILILTVELFAASGADEAKTKRREQIRQRRTRIQKDMETSGVQKKSMAQKRREMSPEQVKEMREQRIQQAQGKMVDSQSKGAGKRFEEFKKAEIQIETKSQDVLTRVKREPVQKLEVNIESQHGRRIARLERIRQIGVEEKNQKIVDRVDKLLAKEKKLYERKSSKVRGKKADADKGKGKGKVKNKDKSSDKK
jgi:hypothetical protein